MISYYLRFAGLCCLLVLATANAAPAEGNGLRTVQRTISSYAFGERTYTCLAIDGGVVPLFVPADAQVQVGDEVKLLWPDDQSFAIFRTATPTEAALLEIMDQAEGAVAWKRYLASTLGDASDQYTVRDFQPGILAVNHWRIGMMALDYSFSGVRSCALLLLWRCQDGTTLAVTMRTAFSDFKARTDAIYGMIGGAMLLPDEQAEEAPATAAK